MEFVLNNDILEYLKASEEETVKLIEELCGIPAPSGQEEKRAEFIKTWLIMQGGENVTIDSANNVLCPVGCDGKNDIVLFMAHTDTVFPDTEPMPFVNDGTYLHSPGVGDDTACLAVLMMIAKYVLNNHLVAPCGILFAANSCEEGLGNLKGIKQIIKDYQGRICEVYTFDGQYNAVVNKCVGSHRYEITFETEGGHSFRDFGNNNAVAVMSEFICRLYDCDVPVFGDSITTYNVGVVEGGTSVNTIAQKAVMMYEYRSDSHECLEIMRTFFESEAEKIKKERNARITVKTIGCRPCGNDVNKNRLAQMTERVISVSEKYSGIPCKATSGSTDCNIPMSLGIPAVCAGSYLGYGEHTREEKVLIDSIPVGLKIAAELILSYFYK